MSAILYILLVLLTFAGPQVVKSDVGCYQLCHCSKLDYSVCTYDPPWATTDCDCCKICFFGIGEELASTGFIEEEYDANLKNLKPFYCQFPIFANLGSCRSGNILPPLNDAIVNHEGFWESATDIWGSETVSHVNVTEITTENSPAVHMITDHPNTKDLRYEFEEFVNNGSSILDVRAESKLYFRNLRRKNLLILLIIESCLGVLLCVFALLDEFILEIDEIVFG